MILLNSELKMEGIGLVPVDSDSEEIEVLDIDEGDDVVVEVGNDADGEAEVEVSGILTFPPPDELGTHQYLSYVSETEEEALLTLTLPHVYSGDKLLPDRNSSQLLSPVSDNRIDVGTSEDLDARIVKSDPQIK